ncbi:putative ribonuclease H-like domain-containing protein [Tanacetum coccineum]
MVPRAVLMKSGLVYIITARQNISKTAVSVNTARQGNPQMDLQDKGVIDSGCSRHMTGNMSYLTDYEEIDGGYVAFGGNPKGGKITGKGTIKSGNLDFENVYFVRELKFNLFSVSQMCDKKNSGPFNDTECIVLSPNFKLIDESQVLLRVPRKNNMYSVDLKNIVPKGGLTCLFAKATSDESKLWHRRLGHLNFKTMNKLVKRNLVIGLPSKLFENDQTCVACQKGKQHRASCKTKIENSISLPLHLLYIDLFGPTFVKSLIKKMYCLVVTDDFSRFTLVFFLATKDETSGILKSFIIGIENLVDHKVKAEAVNTVCYVQNRVLVVKPHNKTPYELFHGRTQTLSFMRPFGCLVTILNTIDNLGKFDSKADEGFFVGYSLNSKAFRLFNSRTRIVEENLHVRFSENTPNVVGSGSDWLFDINALTRTMNYEPIITGTQSNDFADPNSSQDDGSKPLSDDGKKVDEDPRKENECNDQEKEDNVNSTNNVNAASTNEVNVVGAKTSIELPVDPNMPALEDISIFDFSRSDEDDNAEADMNNLDTTIQVSPNPTKRIHKYHPLDQVIGDLQSATQTRRMSKNLEEHGFVSTIQQRTNYKDLQNCLFACFLSQEEPKKVIHALKDPSWIEAMQEELLQFKLQEDERGIVIRNKAILVAQGYIQEEWIDYDEVFAPVARTESIRLFLAYASFKDFVVYQMDVKIVFLYEKIKEEVYVCQPPGFKDPNFPDRVYKVEKALYGLHQALRAWSMIGSFMYLTSSRPDIMFVVCACARYQVNPKVLHLYAVKRIFSDYAGASLDRKSTTGGCQFFGSRLISWQCKKQTVVANSTTEAEYVIASSCRGQSVWNGIGVNTALVDGKKIIITESTMRRDLQLEDVEGVDCLPNSTIFEQLTLMGSKTTTWTEFSSTMASAIICLATNQKFNFSKYIFESMVKKLDNVGKFFMYPRPRKPKRKDTKIPQSSGPTYNVADEAVNEEMDDSLERAATTTTSLDAEQDMGGGPRRQETMGDTIAQTRFENVSKHSNDPPLARGNTLQSGEDSLKLNELMELCTNLQQRVLDLETTKTTQANEIASLKRRVNKLERRNKSRTYGLKRMYRVGSSRRVESSKDKDGNEVIIDNVDVVKTAKERRSVVEEVTDVIEKAKLVSAAKETVNAAATTISTASTILVNAATTTTTTTATITDVEVTLAQAMVELKSAKPKANKDKGKEIIIEEPMVEQVKPMKRLKQIRLDKELAFKLQAKEEEEERLAREKAHQTKEVNIAWDDVQAKIERRKHFAAKRAEEKRNRPPTRAQQRSIMCTYLKNMEGWKTKNLKNKSFANIQELFDKSMKKVNTFVDYRTDSKKARDELEQENEKKQKVDEDKEIAKLQSQIKVVPDDEKEVSIDVVPLATKPPTIVDYQVWKNQDNYSVLDWRLYDSCGVHSLRKQNVYIHMLVEKRYPLTPSTITGMLNKKLQADHFSEMTYQLLKLLTK